MNINKQAKKDAFLAAKATMAYGEGAGIQRKLIWAQVDSRSQRIPGYGEAFQKAMDAQDLGKFAKQAKIDRRKTDAAKAVSRNVKGLATRNYRSVNGSVLILAGAAYVAHQTGLDKKAISKAKDLTRRGKRWLKRRLDEDNVHNITDVQ